MSQQNILLGQTPLLVSDITTIIQTGDADYLKSGVDFLTPYKIALPQYAEAYAGAYYKSSSTITAFPAELADTQYGKTFEVSLPSDCIDDGVTSVTIFYGSPVDGQMASDEAVNTPDDSAWDQTDATVAIFRNRGRKVEVFVPVPVSSSTNLSHKFGYTRYPTYPSATGDAVDVPAEDVDTFINTYYKPQIVKV